MRTHGQREGTITQSEVLWGNYGRDSVGVGSWGGITWGEIPNVYDGVMDAANHYGTCIPM